jgi:Protein of unknown function (DUF3421)
MVQAGTDIDGAPIYVGRTQYNGELVPAKVIPKHNVTFVCSFGTEHIVKDFEVLKPNNYVWKAGSNGVVPAGALNVGHTADGVPFYVGRANYQGSLTPGKVRKAIFIIVTEN